LLQGEDVETGAALPGFEGRHGVVSMTEKVRIKSIAETCRIVVVESRENENVEYNTVDLDGSTDDEGITDDEFGFDSCAEAPGRWEMEAARVYEKTIQLLGDELGKQETYCVL
jgi:hypothetical protein